MVRRVAGAANALLLGAVCALLLAATIAPAVARADGDPASDVLLGQNVFYPYQPPVPIPIQHQLNALTDRAKAAGFPIKVALIGAKPDLGVIPSVFGKPQAYARFLDREISFEGPQPVLVVMYDGYGVAGLNGPGIAAAQSLPKPAGGHSIQLAQAAMAAIPTLAKAVGHPLKASTRGPSGGGGSGSDTALLLIVLILAAVVVATALLLLRLRQATAGSPRS